MDSRGDSLLKETEEVTVDAMNMLVPPEHRKYGGKILADFMYNDNADFNPLGKPRSTEGEGVKRKEITLDKEMGYVNRLLGWAGEHKRAVGLGMIGLLFGGVAANEYRNNKKFADDVDSGIAKAKAMIFGSAPVVVMDPPVNPLPAAANDSKIAANASVTKPLSEEEAYYLILNSDPEKIRKELRKKGYNYTHQFTPDAKVFGNTSFHKEFRKNWSAYNQTYEEEWQNALNELKKTPDFRVGGMPVYDFVTMYLDEMHEGPEGSGPDGLHKPGIIYFPNVEPSTLIHLAIHESGLDTKYADTVSNKNKDSARWKYKREEFATHVQIDWRAIKFKWTPEVKEQKFKNAMTTYG
ncbi:Uncharacterised protein [uncultured archaeon]|nr:Uncharacterised protein [uncultured archaeon]